MQQLYAFFISLFLFISLFVSSVGSITGRQNYRNAKRNLNLTGRGIINFTYFDSNGNLTVDEEGFLNDIATLNYSGDILGAIFYYNNQICVQKENRGEFVRQRFSAEKMSEENKINTINQMLYFILSDKYNLKAGDSFEINIASDQNNDYIAEELFNKLEENTVFVVGYCKGHVFLSGFVLNT